MSYVKLVVMWTSLKGVRHGLMRLVPVHDEQGIKEMVTANKQSDRDDRKHGERNNRPFTHS
jgi:hypothetical protein